MYLRNNENVNRECLVRQYCEEGVSSDTFCRSNSTSLRWGMLNQRKIEIPSEKSQPQLGHPADWRLIEFRVGRLSLHRVEMLSGRKAGQSGHRNTCIGITLQCSVSRDSLFKLIFSFINTVTDLTNALTGNSSVNMFQHATIDETVFYVVRAEQRWNNRVMQPENVSR
jgi:hypothetical protein